MSLHKIKSKGPSIHLNWKELACKDGTSYPDKFIEDGRVFRLAEVFEDIRFIWDESIVVLSAYRTPAWNKKVGRAKNSQHLYGRALDLKPPPHIPMALFYSEIKKIAREIGLGGLGRYSTFVHVDIRPRMNGHIAMWSGTGVKDSLT